MVVHVCVDMCRIAVADVVVVVVGVVVVISGDSDCVGGVAVADVAVVFSRVVGGGDYVIDVGIDVVIVVVGVVAIVVGCVVADAVSNGLGIDTYVVWLICCYCYCCCCCWYWFC